MFSVSLAIVQSEAGSNRQRELSPNIWASNIHPLQRELNAAGFAFGIELNNFTQKRL